MRDSALSGRTITVILFTGHMGFQAGDIVGDYRIVGVLGRGGMGQVFRVRNLISDREEAMKVALPDMDAEADLADRFLREIKVHASLVHPNIAALYTAVRIDKQILMIMELIEGVSLEQKLREGRVGLEEGMGYMDQALSALAFAHGRGVTHRDIKPANMIVTPDGIVKLTDFGIARATGISGITHTGMALGSPYYMSPEQVKASPVDARSDLYAIGVTMYEIATGQRPLQGENVYAVMSAHLTRIPVPPAEIVPGLPAGLSDVILRCLEKEPDDRFQSAQELQAALRGVMGSAGSMTQTPRAVSRRSATLSAADTARLAKVESRLTRVLGPIARSLVAKAARQHSNLADICNELAREIPDPAERDAFLRAYANSAATGGGERGGTSGRRTPGASMVPVSPAPAFDQETLDAARQRLAAYIGPIARMVVERAARKVGSTRELYQKLALEIPEEKDRRAFLASAPGGAATRPPAAS